MYNLTMTRKDYIKFAELLRELRPTVNPEASDEAYATILTLDEVAKGMCRIFAQDNGNFDRNRFLTAAGVQE